MTYFSFEEIHLAWIFFFANPNVTINTPNAIAPSETFWALISELKKKLNNKIRAPNNNIPN